MADLKATISRLEVDLIKVKSLGSGSWHELTERISRPRRARLKSYRSYERKLPPAWNRKHSRVKTPEADCKNCRRISTLRVRRSRICVLKFKR